MRIGWSIILISLTVIGTIFTVGCGEPEVQTPKQYVPKYSANQVIAVVKAQYSTCFKREYSEADGGFRTLDTPTQISVQFIGGSKGAWKVTITCPHSYRLGAPSSRVTSLTGYFWESDGGLHQGYIP